jgi:hypothetical protein
MSAVYIVATVKYLDSEFTTEAIEAFVQACKENSFSIEELKVYRTEK